MDKSYVTFEQHVCVVCGHSFDTGSLLLDKRLRKKFNRYTVNGWGMCPEHQKLKDDGFVALIGCKAPNYGDTIKIKDADRTGRLAHIRATAWSNVFDVPIPERGMCFVDDKVLDTLAEAVAPAPDVEEVLCELPSSEDQKK